VRRLPWLAAVLVAALPVALPAQTPGKSPVLLYVTVPADAKLAVNGVPVRQTGPERRLISPPIPVGEKGIYTLTLNYARDGKPVTVEREIVVTGGETKRVDLTKEEPKTDESRVEPKVEPKTVLIQPKAEPKQETPPAPPKADVKLDAPYVPTPAEMVDKMLEVAGVKEADTVYDLGSGDGRIVIEAVKKYKAKRGVGIEKAPERVQLAKGNAASAGVGERVEIRQGDVLKLKDLSDASVVTLQLLPDVNEKLRPVLRKTLKPGSRVVSYDFDMGEEWKPEKEVTVKDKGGREHTIYLWTIKEGQKEKKDNLPPIPIKKVPKAEPKKEEPTIRVPYVPTPETVVEEMLKLGGVKEGDVVYDLGCGDGRIVVAAVKDFKAKKGVGVDIDPQRVKESKQNAKAAKVEDRVEFRQEDVLKIADVSEATVVTLYLFPEVNEKLAPVLKKTLKPGSRVVSHDFLMGEYDWKPDKKITVKDAGGDAHELFLWTIK